MTPARQPSRNALAGSSLSLVARGLGPVERREESPTVVVLDRLARTLKVHLSEFFAEPAKGAAPPQPLRKAGDRRSGAGPPRVRWANGDKRSHSVPAMLPKGHMQAESRKLRAQIPKIPFRAHRRVVYIT